MGQTTSMYGEKNSGSDQFRNQLNRDMMSTPYSSGSSTSKWLQNHMEGPVSASMCGGSLDSVNLSSVLDDAGKEYLDKELGNPPPTGGPVNTPLPGVSARESLKYGYQRYADGDGRFYGTERTIWRLKAAGKLLAKEQIVMGIGDISQKNGGQIKPHATHRNGLDVDLRMVDSNGANQSCKFKNKGCYNEAKTFTMLKTLIDVDPSNAKRIIVGDRNLALKINLYHAKKTQNKALEEKTRAAIANPGIKLNTKNGFFSTLDTKHHHNHIHFSWKK